MARHPKAKTKNDLHHHARRRAKQRYGIELGADDMDRLVDQICNHQALFVQKMSNRVTHYIVQIQGKRLACVYDKTRKAIATFLPPACVDIFTAHLAEDRPGFAETGPRHRDPWKLPLDN